METGDARLGYAWRWRGLRTGSCSWLRPYRRATLICFVTRATPSPDSRSAWVSDPSHSPFASHGALLSTLRLGLVYY